MMCRHCSAENTPGDSWCAECGEALDKAAKDPLLGRVMGGQFILRRKLGEGGFGSVYLADQPSMGRSVVVKTLHPHLTQRSTLVQRFHREGITASRLEHPYAVKMYGSGESEDGHLWIAMEHLAGETFTQRIKTRGPMTEAQLLRFAGPLCEVLSEAHQKGIIHRDLKPDNVMVVNILGRELPKILDFGLAGVLHDDKITQPGSISGTPAYMPPEQWQGLSQTDHRSDIYALGLIFYYALTARLPFSADSPMAWALVHQETAPKSFAALHIPIRPAVEVAILRALAKRPEDRFQSVQAFYEALEASISEPDVPEALPARGGPVVLSEAPGEVALLSAPRLPRPAQGRGVLLGAGVSLAVVVGFLGWSSGSPAEGPREVAPTPSALAALVAKAPGGFEGRYVGSGACCGFPQTVRFSLSSEGGVLRGVWEATATVEGVATSLGSVAIEGLVSDDGGSIIVRGVRWLDNPKGLPLSSFRGVLMPDGSLRGEADAATTGCFCTTFTFVKQ